MLDLKFIRENKDTVKKAIRDRKLEIDIDFLLTLDAQRREILKKAEDLKHKKNTASQEIGQKVAKKEDVNSLKSEMKALSQKINKFDIE